jgi:hypothetical protein
MKRILMVVMLLLPGVIVSAQDRPAQGAQKLEQVAKQLNLTPAQEIRLVPILKAEAPKLEAIKSNASLSPMQKMQQLKAIHDETDPQVRGILTTEQYQKLQTIRRQEIQQAIRNRQSQ